MTIRILEDGDYRLQQNGCIRDLQQSCLFGAVTASPGDDGSCGIQPERVDDPFSKDESFPVIGGQTEIVKLFL